MGADDMKRIQAVEQKAALHRMLERNTRPEKAIADLVGVAPQTLWGWADASIDSHLPGSRIPRLLAASDDDSLLQYWATLQGRTVVTLPKGATSKDVAQFAEFATLLERWRA